MPLIIPPELKKITQYIRRAEELDNDTTPQTRIVAYYCRQHAVQTGIPLATTPPSQKCLSSMLHDLEKEKSKIKNAFTKEEAYTICREFAMKVFDKADGIDRMGKSNKSTAQSFYAAASFLDILGQFHRVQGGDEEEKSEEILEEGKKSFYAKWKAMDILKAIREGREIKPGGFGNIPQDDDGDDDDDDKEVEIVQPSVVSRNDDDGVKILPPPPYPGPSSKPTAPSLPPPAATAPPTTTTTTTTTTSPVKTGFMGGMFGKKDNGKYSKGVLTDATELVKKALASLKEKDGDLASEKMQQAIEALTQESIGTLQSNNKNGKYSKNVLLDATELANFAKKALKEKDGDLTIERLQDAVNILMM